MKRYKGIILREGLSTPWGQADNIKKLATGIMWVGTPGPGGLAISKALAKKMLSPEAIHEAIEQGSYYWWEEDVAWTVPMYDSEELLNISNKTADKKIEKSEYKTIQDHLFSCLFDHIKKEII